MKRENILHECLCELHDQASALISQKWELIRATERIKFLSKKVGRQITELEELCLIKKT